MKVWGTTMYFNKDGRQCRAVVATKTKKRAVELLDLTLYTFNNYSCVTGNKEEIAAAMKEPETVVIMEVY
jgi:hypothetical protein